MTDIPDDLTAKITAAVRELHASENSAARANRELNDLIPLGAVVLYKIPWGGTKSGKQLYYAYYHSEGNYGPSYTSGDIDLVRLDQETAILVDVPDRKAEYLPRLGEGRQT